MNEPLTSKDQGPDGFTLDALIAMGQRTCFFAAAETDAIVRALKELRDRRGVETPAERELEIPLISDPECDEAIASLETYEWTGFTREDIRLLFGTIWNSRAVVKTSPKCPDAGGYECPLGEKCKC